MTAPNQLGTRRRSALRGLVAAAAISSTGDGLAAVAFPLVAIGLTHDARLIAAVAAASRLPWLVCSLPAGALVDRCSARRVVAVTEGARTVLLLLTAWAVASHAASVPLLCLVAFAVGTCETAFSAAVQSTVPALVAEQDLERANGRMYAAQMGGELFLGPALGGLAFAIGPSVPFVGDGLSFAVCGAVLLATLPRWRVDLIALERRSATLGADMLEGLRWFLSHRLIRLLAVVVGSLAFFQAMVNGVAVVYAAHVLHLSKAGFGLFIAVGSVGNVLGASVASRVKGRWGTGQLLAVAGVLAAVSYLVEGATSTTAVAVTVCAVESLVVLVGNVANLSLRQRIVPAQLRGRVSNLFRAVVYGAVPLGALFGGVVTEAAGVRAALVLAGAAQLAVLGTARALLREVAVYEPARPAVALAVAA